MKTKVKILLLFLIILCTVGIPSVYAKLDNSKLKEGHEITKEDLDLDDVYRITQNNDDEGTIDITGINKSYADIYYKGETTLEFPESINGKKVRYIKFKIKSLGDFKKIVMPAGTTQIIRNVFSDCTELEEVVIPDSVIVIGENAFYNCVKLKNIDLPDSLTSIKDFAFAGCRSLTKIELPDKVSSVGVGAFQNCSGIKTVRLTDKISVIEDSTFEGCSSLQEIELSTNVEKIKPFAFNNCNGLAKATINNSKVAISYGAFEKTNALTIYGHNVSTAKTYATNNNIKFVALPETMTSVEKAGILMASFLTQCVEKYGGDPKVDKYGGYIQYGTTNRHLNVFYRKPEEGELAPLKTNSNGEVYRDAINSLDCVGCVNLYVYQSTGLWSSNFTSYNSALNAPTYDNMYIGPKNFNSKLKATDLFEYIGGTSNTNGYTFNTLEVCAANGTLKPGDLLTMSNHVAMYAGWNGSKMLIGENYGTTNAWSNFTSTSIGWSTNNISVARIKKEAADAIPGLAELSTKEEIEDYGRALADAYFKGSTTYKGQTLYRKIYTQTHIMVGDSATQDLTFKNKTVKANDGTYKSLKLTGKCKDMTVKQMKEKLIGAKGYTRVDILDKNGNVITDENRKITTGMKVRGYIAKTSTEVGSSQVLFTVGEEGTEDEEVEEYNTVVYGDVTGKGEPGAIDALAIVKNNTGKISLENEVFVEAGRVTKKSRENDLIPSSVDAYYISSSKLGRCEIEQGDFEEIEIIDENGNVIPLYTREDLENVGSGKEYISKTTQETYVMETDAKYVLMADIDLSDNEWVPIGREATDETESTIITNAFDGNGHKITGLKITGSEDDENIGLFAICKAKISNLTIEAPEIEYNANNKTVGSIIGKMIIDDDFSGYILNNVNLVNDESDIINIDRVSETYEKGNVGGAIGKVELSDDVTTDKKLSIYNCTNSMDISGYAGLIGSINLKKDGIDAELIVCECNNYGDLTKDDNTGLSFGGLIGTAIVNTIDIYKCVNEGNMSTNEKYTGEAGGLIGYAQTANLWINSCENKGIISIKNSIVGGLIGKVYTLKTSGLHEIYLCNLVNSGNINNTAVTGGSIGSVDLRDVESILVIDNCRGDAETIIGSHRIGGIVGELINYELTQQDCTTIIINNCNNSKIDTSDTSVNSSTSGGIVGQIDKSNYLVCINNFNYGDVIGNSSAGGIFGGTYYIRDSKCIHNENKGNIKSISYSAGGIFGKMCGSYYDPGEIYLSDLTNYGEIINKNYANDIGGIAGEINIFLSGEIKDCTNKGKITSSGCSSGGCFGIVALTKNENENEVGTLTISNCNNDAQIESSSGGGIIGVLASECKFIVNNCSNSGDVTGSEVGGIIYSISHCDLTISNCRNSGNLHNAKESWCSVGGIIALSRNGAIARVSGNSNSGSFDYNNYENELYGKCNYVGQ